MVLLTQKMDILDQFFLADQVFRSTAVGSVADQDELRSYFLADQSENFDDIGKPFDRAKIGKMHKNRFAVRSPFGAQSGIIFPAVEIAIHKIGDHFDRMLDVEFIERALFQIMGNGGHAVRLLDGKFCDRQKTSVIADERDIRAVKRGNKRQFVGRRHGAGQQRADRMRNGIVDVQQVQILRFGHLHHFHRERQRVWGVVEKGIAGILHFMEVNSFVGVSQADGRRITDEMDFMAARCQFHSQFGGNDA